MAFWGSREFISNFFSRRTSMAPRTPHAGSRSEEISALDSMSIVVVAAEGAALFVAGYALRGFVDRQRRRRRADRQWGAGSGEGSDVRYGSKAV